jgi:hypothetical protein
MRLQLTLTAAKRALHAQAATAHRLTERSNLIRPLSRTESPRSVRDDALRDDFLLWPAFFRPEEARQLLAMALWKLDRVDSTMRRRRRTGGLPSPTPDLNNLQDMFQGQYGFEEVSSHPLLRRIMLISCFNRVIMIQSFTSTAKRSCRRFRLHRTPFLTFPPSCGGSTTCFPDRPHRRSNALLK